MPDTLMHKSVPVLEFEFKDDKTMIQSVGKIFNPEHIPLGLGLEKGVPDPSDLYNWLKRRLIPDDRHGIADLFEVLKINSMSELIGEGYALSLSDHYWRKPEGEEISWERINFFDNDFSTELGDFLFGKIDFSGNMEFNTPDLTTNGPLKKRWVIRNGRRVLTKCGAPDFYQETVNEVIAAIIFRRLGIPHVSYTLEPGGREPRCSSENFLSRNTEFIPAYDILQCARRYAMVPDYGDFLEVSEYLGIDGAKKCLEEMFVVDFIIANKDRNLFNFGAIRNAETLKFEGMAPIFDTGTALSHDRYNISPSVKSKPFRDLHLDQVKLVEDFSFLDVSALKGLCSELGELLARSPWISPERGGGLCHAIQDRISTLGSIIQEIKGDPTGSEQPLKRSCYL
jgi:hypothetical protein